MSQLAVLGWTLAIFATLGLMMHWCHRRGQGWGDKNEDDD